MTVVQLLRKNGVGAVHLEKGIVTWASRIEPMVPRY
jgi:rhodanese-related sulfurtransferase